MTGVSYRYDLRSNAIDFKRDRETKQKWGPNALKGERVVHQDRNAVSNKPKPANERDCVHDHFGSSHRQRIRHARARSQYKKADPLADPNDDPRQALGQEHEMWSTDESTPEAEDYNIMYSFDAPRGPSQGQEVLTQALSKAVFKFEDHQTVKLVKDEYDVVADGDEESYSSGGQVDEDFEMV